ncbi:hypothetical protein RhiirA5_433450 [Rhizophagus irregularis]|uniref:Uncharacterized protein n=1 Tax=Rhizophagus irregularis TaxID=588596 RepID=A0A2I1EW16_9GLOM|nr:hypothetical protein RhiirA5_433450 [Rhizophagus irregularis]PKY26312.1 hypothetical protein RhiirB3_441569 [Rhizophagus irregularis]
MASLDTKNEDLNSLKMLSSSEHWGNNQLPIQFMKELNIQTKSTKNNICTKDDTSREPNDYTLASYDGDDKIVSFEIWEASKLLCCHLFDTSEMIDNKPPLSLYPICYEDRDELEVLLIGSKPSFITFEKTGDKDIVQIGENITRERERQTCRRSEVEVIGKCKMGSFIIKQARLISTIYSTTSSCQHYAKEDAIMEDLLITNFKNTNLLN